MSGRQILDQGEADNGQNHGAKTAEKIQLDAKLRRRMTVFKQQKPPKKPPDRQKSYHNYDTATVNKDKEDEKEKKKRAMHLITSASPFRRHMYVFIESMSFSGFILVVILLNTAMLCALTFNEVQVKFGWYARIIDYIMMVIYFVECALKLYVWRLYFFKEQWNVIDFTIVCSNIADYSTQIILENDVNILKFLVMFRAMRALRAIRVLRTVRFLKNIQVIMNTCLQSMQSMGAIVMLISLFLYMFAVIGRGLYADVDPSRFGDLWKAVFTLFQLLTLDDWFYIYLDAVHAKPEAVHIIFYLITYIVVEYFIFLNLFVAVLVDNFQLTLEAAAAEDSERRKALKAAESQHDEDEFAENVPSDASLDTEIEAPYIRKTLEEYYPSYSYSEREQAYLGHFLLLLAAIECNGHIHRNQKGTLDKITDLVQETMDDV
ncbi:cation channel sperm-associated protein 1-like isoform X1 [Ptychodera flava]|uniref:cation channel sperm-associated protein 1-like isoform X1 n=1 Tax=Ptychodera flava TaxID=63121 RepID=UPI003969DF96